MSFEVTVAEVGKLIEQGAVLVDVREDEEWAAGYAPESRHIVMAELPEEYDDLPEDKVIVMICRSGARSATTTEFMVRQGYDARNLVGGLLAWVEAGLPLVTDSGSPGQII